MVGMIGIFMIKEKIESDVHTLRKSSSTAKIGKIHVFSVNA